MILEHCSSGWVLVSFGASMLVSSGMLEMSDGSGESSGRASFCQRTSGSLGASLPSRPEFLLMFKQLSCALQSSFLALLSTHLCLEYASYSERSAFN